MLSPYLDMLHLEVPMPRDTQGLGRLLDTAVGLLSPGMQMKTLKLQKSRVYRKGYLLEPFCPHFQMPRFKALRGCADTSLSAMTQILTSYVQTGI